MALVGVWYNTIFRHAGFDFVSLSDPKVQYGLHLRQYIGDVGFAEGWEGDLSAGASSAATVCGGG